MLKLLNGNDNPVLNIDNFYIDELWSGLDELVFDIPVADPAYKSILEESVIEYEQPYLVKAIDGGKTTAKIKCQLNLDALKAGMLLAYSNNSNTVAGTISGVAPAGWAAVDHSYFTTRRTIESDGATPLEIIQECLDTYGVVIRFDVKHKQIHIWDPDSFEPIGAFASRDLNLTEVNYKGKSSDLVTRLYAEGKDGLTFASINGGKAYVEDFTYTDKVISAYWKDERYTVAENLLADAKKQLKELAVPSMSYSCNVLDLAKTNPELYAHQDFSLMQVVRLVDDIKGQSLNHQVVQYRRYPFYPQKNVVTLSTVAPKIQSTVKNLQIQIEKPSSPFRQLMQAAIDSATEWITGADGGAVVLHQDANGKPYELLIMDMDNIETARHVWRFNKNGWGYSSTGYNGPYTMAATVDGGFVANFIVAGTMLCDRLMGGTLTLGGKNNGNGVLIILDANNKEIGRWDANGIVATAGHFSGDITGASGIFNGILQVVATAVTGNNPVRIKVPGTDDDGVIYYTYFTAGTDGFVVARARPNNCKFIRMHVDTGDGIPTFSGGSFNSFNETTWTMEGIDERLKIHGDGEIKSPWTYSNRGSSEANVHINGSQIFQRTSSSSRRYKKYGNTKLDTLDPEALYDLPVRRFKYKKGYLAEGDQRADQWVIGFFAEEIAEIYPCAVEYEGGEVESWNSRIMIPAMLKLIQDQRKQLQEQEEKIKEQKKRMEDMEERLKRLEELIGHEVV